jgi:hypothetical protein
MGRTNGGVWVGNVPLNGSLGIPKCIGRQTMSELQPEELLLTVAATITENEMDSMISSSELAQLIQEPAVSVSCVSKPI